MESRSVIRELSLLLLSQISENEINQIKSFSIEKILNKALDTLMQHWREELDFCASELELAQDELRDSEFKEFDKNSNNIVRKHLTNCLTISETIINSLSDMTELSRLLSLSDQQKIKEEAISRVTLVLNNINLIDLNLDNVMEGWRLKRLPRIDRDILRLAFVELNYLNIPIPVLCNEAVNLANRYSDEHGRRMINGVLRRVQKDSSTLIAK
tara:strand:- start:4359 stop:4997 length:639 start_codon:yes stop_codon:yes gene_type:complete